jgi:hypothetical protein
LLVYAEDINSYLSLWLKSKLLRKREEKPFSDSNKISLLSLYSTKVNLTNESNENFEDEEFEDDIESENHLSLNIVIKMVTEKTLSTSLDIISEMKGTHSLIYLLPLRKKYDCCLLFSHLI